MNLFRLVVFATVFITSSIGVGRGALSGAVEAEGAVPSSALMPADLRAAFMAVSGAEDGEEPYAQNARLAALDGAAGDSFGTSVALDGDTALVGVWGADLNGGTKMDAGAAYMFVRVNGVWTQQAKLTAADAFNGDNFGISVALDGSTALIGAWGADLDGTSLFGAGAAYVFVRNGDIWTQQWKLTAIDARPYDGFGFSVALDGDTALIGAYSADLVYPNLMDGGAAYVFTRANGFWSHQAKLVSAETMPFDWFGYSVALDANTAVIGAPLADLGNPQRFNAGAVYVFTRSGMSWGQQARLFGFDANNDDRFGVSAAVDGDTMVVGADQFYYSGQSGAGAAYTFTRSSSTWTAGTKLIGFDALNGSRFGLSVALSGDRAAVGANHANAVYLFNRAGSVWTPGEKLTIVNGAAGDQLGRSVALDGNRALAGAWLADSSAPTRIDAGAAYVFDVGALSSNLLENGTFSVPIGSGDNNWGVFPQSSAFITRINGGVFEFYATSAGAGAAILQRSGDAIAPNTGIEVALDLGNTSPNRKRATVIAWDSTFSDLRVCTFWLPAGSALQTYRMQFRTAQAWGNAQLHVYVSSPDGAGWYRMDNAIMRTNNAIATPTTTCFDPNAPAPTGEPDGANLIANGTFSSPIGNGVGTWGIFPEDGTLITQLANGIFGMRRTGSVGVLLQDTLASLPNRAIIEATFQLGSTATTTQRLTVLIRSRDFSDLSVCTFWLPPNTPLGNYTIRTYTTQAWTAGGPDRSASISFYASTTATSGFLQVDNVSLRARPSLTVTGTECYPAGTSPADASFLPFSDTAQPYYPDGAQPELPLLATPGALPEPPADAEGSVTEP